MTSIEIPSNNIRHRSSNKPVRKKETKLGGISVAPRFVLLTLRPEHSFAHGNRLKLAVATRDLTGPLEHGEDLGNGRRVTRDLAVRGNAEDRRLHGHAGP